MQPRVYLAGPDVFFPAPQARGAALKAVCARHGLAGVFPLDPLADEPAGWAALSEPARIHRRNEAHIAASAGMIANLTPFRGPSADVGTAVEIGFMRALGRPVFGWAATTRPYLARVLAQAGPEATADAAGVWRDGAGMEIEAFGLADNLMLEGAIEASGGRLFTGEDAGLALVEACARALARLLASGR